VTRLAVELGQLRLEAGAHVPDDVFRPHEVTAGEDRAPTPGGEGQVGGQRVDTCLPVRMSIVSGREYGNRVQLRYNYRLYPDGPQRVALGRAFG
jgi:hypothetical protein